METMNSADIKLSVILLCITAFFYGIIGNGYILLLISFIPVIPRLCSVIAKNPKVPANWFVFIVLVVASGAFSSVSSKKNNFIFMMVLLLLIKLLLEYEFGWQRFFAKVICFFALINVIATFVSMFAPDVMISYAKNVFDGASLEVYLKMLNNGAYAGINGQTSQNGFFISFFMAFVIINIFSNRKKTLNYILLIFTMIALILTQKRSFLLGNTIAALVLFWSNTLSDKNKVRKVFALAVIIFIAYLVFSYHPATKGLIEKMTALENAGDITNGRSASWKDTLEIWKRYPVFGVGANSLVNVYDLSSHNVYLQTLAEMGLLGAASYVILLLTTLKNTFDIYQIMLRNNLFDEKDKRICGVSLYIQVLFIIYSFFGNPLYGISFILPYTLFTAAAGSYFRYFRGKEYETGNINISQHA